MGWIDDADVLQVQRASDIVQVVQSFIGPLKRTGSRYKALCPFHEEKTPSFSIDPAKQMYYCFGCHTGGDVIHFVMTHEKLDFPDAVRLLADRAGIRLREREGDSGAGDLRKQIFEVNAWAASFFRDLLVSSEEGAAAREYVKKRGIRDAMAEEFRLGFSHPSWDRLLTRGRAKGYAPELLEKAGLVLRRQEGPGWYDRFRNRLMFPIVDPSGRVVGFGARSLDGSEPKYLNSPETPIFSKGRGFYGLNFAKEVAAKDRRLHLVEGYTDVIMARQHGVEGVVATLGTALTRDHLAILRRYVETIVLVYDGDAAGAKASERSTDLLLGEELEIRVARLPAGEDPCDTLVKSGAEAFRASLAGSRELFEFLLEAATAGKRLDEAGVRARAADGLIARIAAVPNPVRREMLVKRTAEAFGVSEDAVRARLRALGAASGAGPGAARPAGPKAETAPTTEADRVGERLIKCVLQAPDRLSLLRERVPLEAFPGTRAQAIARTLYGLKDAKAPQSPAELAGLLRDPALESCAAALLMDEEKVNDALFLTCIEWVDRNSLQQQIREAKAKGDLARVKALFERLDKVLPAG